MKKNPIMLIGIILISNISVSYVAAQSSRKKISEYYFNTPLAEVINDFINKYGYDIEYDTALVAQYDFTDGGRFRPSISITGALEAIKSDFPLL